MSQETVNTAETVICIDPLKSGRIRIHLIHRFIFLIQMEQILVPVLDRLMFRLCQKIPVKLSLLTPFTQLGKLLTHEEKLLARMSHHERIAGFQICIFIKSKSRHLIDHGALQMHNLIMGKYKDIVLAVSVGTCERHHVVGVLSEIWIQFHIFSEIMHPAHIPLQAEPETAVLRSPCYLRPRS